MVLICVAVCKQCHAFSIFEKGEKLENAKANHLQWIKKPWFCHKIDCPQFTVDKNTTSYQIRTYNSSQWMTTTFANDPNYDASVQKGFMKLFSYISGANVKKQKIPMTAPVISLINTTGEPGPFCAASITVGFFLPVGGPAPTDPSLAAFTLKSATFAVGSYGGYASNKTIIQSGAALAHALSTDKVAFNDEIVFAASYDAPYRFLNRHNEVWFQLK